MSNKDRANLLAILDAIGKIQNYIEGVADADAYFHAPMIFDATLMNFVVIGEMVDRLSAELKNRDTEIDWQKVKDFRNLVAHDYLGIDAEEVWQIICNHLRPLKIHIEGILRELSPE